MQDLPRTRPEKTKTKPLFLVLDPPRPWRRTGHLSTRLLAGPTAEGPPSRRSAAGWGKPEAGPRVAVRVTVPAGTAGTRMSRPHVRKGTACELGEHGDSMGGGGEVAASGRRTGSKSKSGAPAHPVRQRDGGQWGRGVPCTLGHRLPRSPQCGDSVRSLGVREAGTRCVRHGTGRRGDGPCWEWRRWCSTLTHTLCLCVLVSGPGQRRDPSVRDGTISLKEAKCFPSRLSTE